MSHRWGPSPLSNVAMCDDCHMISSFVDTVFADAVPCEHIWRATIHSNAYECDCGTRVSHQSMLSRLFPGHCPIVGPMPAPATPPTRHNPPPTYHAPGNGPPPPWNASAGKVTTAPAYHMPLPAFSVANGFRYQDLDFPNEKEETNPPGKYPKCRGCGVDLCAVLDAYYGKDPALVGKCERCRGRSGT